MKFSFPIAAIFAAAFLGLCAQAFGVKISGQEYFPLASSVRKFGLITRVSADGKEAICRNRSSNQSASFTLNQRYCLINGTKFSLSYPIAEHKDRLHISKIDFERTLTPLMRPEAFALSRYRLRRIVLDAGHGGKDTGARNPHLKLNEKTLTLDVAKRVKQQLEDLGYNVTLTRDDDRFIELKDRPKLANTLRADLFVSLHFNAAKPDISGIETYVYTPQGAPSSSKSEPTSSDNTFQPGNIHDIASLWAAYNIQRTVSAKLRSPDRGVRHARFVVLETLRCPGLLFEGGYITSKMEASRLSSSLYRQQLASAIVEGIRGYHRRILGM